MILPGLAVLPAATPQPHLGLPAPAAESVDASLDLEERPLVVVKSVPPARAPAPPPQPVPIEHSSAFLIRTRRDQVRGHRGQREREEEQASAAHCCSRRRAPQEAVGRGGQHCWVSAQALLFLRRWTSRLRLPPACPAYSPSSPAHHALAGGRQQQRGGAQPAAAGGSRGVQRQCGQVGAEKGGRVAG